MLARELPLRAVVSQIMALPPAMLQGYNGTPFPPTLFLHMPRDGRTAALVSKCVGRLSQQGRPVAEIGAAMVMAHLGLNNTVREDHIKYVKSWLKELTDDKKAVVTAGSKAQKALDWMVDQQDEEALAQAA